MSKIEWTNKTWNPIVSGCSIISAGCTNCYAMKMAFRLAKMGQEKYKGLTKKTEKGNIIWNGKVKIDMNEALFEPLKRKKSTMYFVNSMTDLFHEDVPFEAIDKIMAVVALCPQHTFQVLTKRPERMKEYFERLQTQKPTLLKCDDNDDIAFITYFRDNLPAKYRTAPSKMMKLLTQFITPDNPENPVFVITEPFMKIQEIKDLYGVGTEQEKESNEWILKTEKQSTVFNLPLPNLWLGVSIENQEQADKRIPYLLETPAKVRFLSCEPLLGVIDFLLNNKFKLPNDEYYEKQWHTLKGTYVEILNNKWTADVQKEKIDWVIVGGESGKGARPMHPDWVRSIRNQCKEANVSFFFKQWGEYMPLIGTGDLIMNKTDKIINEFGDSSLLTQRGCFIGFSKVGKHNAGRLLDGVEYNEMPEK